MKCQFKETLKPWKQKNNCQKYVWLTRKKKRTNAGWKIVNEFWQPGKKIEEKKNSTL